MLPISIITATKLIIAIVERLTCRLGLLCVIIIEGLMDIQSLDLTKGMIARTLLIVEGKPYEIMTCKTSETIDDETAKFWEKLISELPYESVVYMLVDAKKPYSQIEQRLAEMVPVNSTLRRDLELGDLYVERTKDEDSAALAHQKIIEEFRSGEILLLTLCERDAINGPSKL